MAVDYSDNLKAQTTIVISGSWKITLHYRKILLTVAQVFCVCGSNQEGDWAAPLKQVIKPIKPVYYRHLRSKPASNCTENRTSLRFSMSKHTPPPTTCYHIIHYNYQWMFIMIINYSYYYLLLLLLLLCSNYCYFFIVMQIDQKLHILDMPPAAAFAGAAVVMCISTIFREMLLLSLLRINRCTQGMHFFFSNCQNYF